MSANLKMALIILLIGTVITVLMDTFLLGDPYKTIIFPVAFVSKLLHMVFGAMLFPYFKRWVEED